MHFLPILCVPNILTAQFLERDEIDVEKKREGKGVVVGIEGAIEGIVIVRGTNTATEKGRGTDEETETTATAAVDTRVPTGTTVIEKIATADANGTIMRDLTEIMMNAANENAPKHLMTFHPLHQMHLLLNPRIVLALFAPLIVCLLTPGMNLMIQGTVVEEMVVVTAMTMFVVVLAEVLLPLPLLLLVLGELY